MLFSRRLSATASQIRKSFIDYFEAANHVHVPSSSVVPKDDPSLLFVSAGMNQFKSILTGAQPVPPGQERVVNSQKCIRAGGKHNDLDDVGADGYHHTFFEMLGNWSFGSYYKAEACEYAWKYLTNVLNIPESRLYVTYFRGCDVLGVPADMECFEIWRRLGLSPDRIIPSSAKDNFWEMAKYGPCGPCSEIHIDKDPNREHSVPHLVNADRPEVVELWNIVFMQYDRTESGIHPLPNKNIDCGMGFERLVSVLQGVDSNYDTDVFTPIFSTINSIAKNGPYEGRFGQDDASSKDWAYRVTADHLRTVSVALADGVRPAGTGRGHVVRKMLRRAALAATDTLGIDRFALSDIATSAIATLSDAYPNLQVEQGRILKTISEEETKFFRVLDNGKKIFERYADKLPKTATAFPAALAFKLHDAHGFPIELTQKFAFARGLSVDLHEFDRLIIEASELSKSRSKMNSR
uniref:alanine--tRNA ligase n=1 Tax=Panagrellus redivivus TaxID=6233 RepID=A0A7E4WAL2_PANRE